MWTYEYSQNNDTVKGYDHNGDLRFELNNPVAPKVRTKDSVPVEPDFRDAMWDEVETEFESNNMELTNWILKTMRALDQNDIESG